MYYLLLNDNTKLNLGARRGRDRGAVERNYRIREVYRYEDN